MSKEYKLLLSHKQLRVLERALDLHNRIGSGQLEMLMEALTLMFPKEFKGKQIPTLVKKYIEPMKRELLGLTETSSFGISNAGDDSKIGYDLQKVIQKKIAEVEEHHRWSVWYDGSMNIGSEPNAEISEVKPVPKIRQI